MKKPVESSVKSCLSYFSVVYCIFSIIVLVSFRLLRIFADYSCFSGMDKANLPKLLSIPIILILRVPLYVSLTSTLINYIIDST